MNELITKGCPRGVVSEFELQPRHYIHFRTNTLGKGMNPHILQAIMLNSTTTMVLALNNPQRLICH